MRCTLMRRYSFLPVPRGKRPMSISRLTNSIARSSAISGALKVISLTRFMIPRVEVGIFLRTSGLICTINTSSAWVERKNG